MYNFDEMINRIKALKKALKLSNESLANLAEIPKGTLSKILGSETKDPQISNIIKLSQALGVTSDYIIFGKIEPSHDEECVSLLSKLNDVGKAKALEYMRDLIGSGHYSCSEYDTISADAVQTISRCEQSATNSPTANINTKQK